MPGWFWVVLFFVLLAGYVATKSSRLDRLHARVDTTRAALDAQLLRRAAVTLEIAASGLLDPASSVLLASAAHDARASSGDDGDREVVESRLTVALRAAFADPDAAETLAAEPTGRALLAELEAATTKVPLGRRFFNDAVRATLAVRRHGLARWLRLAGRVPAPTFFEMDDEAPAHVAVPDGVGSQGGLQGGLHDGLRDGLRDDLPREDVGVEGARNVGAPRRSPEVD